MKNYFKEFNLARAIILVAIVGSLAFAFLGWRQTQKLDELRDNLDKDVPKLVKEVESLGRKHTLLTKSKNADELVAEKNLESYIRRAAGADSVEIGEVDLKPSKNTVGKGVIDQKYRITPHEKDRQFQRSRIANFLYKLESDSRRVRLTDVALDLAEKKKVRSHEIPEDVWTYDVELTSRQREEKP